MNENGKSYTTKYAIIIAAFFVAVMISVVVGRYSLSVPDFLKLLWSRLPFFDVAQTRDPAAEKVLFEIRLPRVAAAVLAGAALSLAGLCYQGMFRNPLVSPDILGASTGAGFGAAMAILLGAGYAAITASAFCFGLLAVFFAYFVSRGIRTHETLAMILAGMVISALFSSGTSFIKLVADTDNQLPAITYWLMGQLSSVKIADLQFMIIPVAAGMIPLFVLRWRLNMLTVDEDTARSAGANIPLLRLVVVVCATMLTAATVAVAGPVSWIGLVIPHLCRMLFGSDYKRLIPATALFGATFLLVVDDIARTVTAGELPLGILTSLAGAPLFLYLLLKGGAWRR